MTNNGPQHINISFGTPGNFEFLNCEPGQTVTWSDKGPIYNVESMYMGEPYTLTVSFNGTPHPENTYTVRAGDFRVTSLFVYGPGNYVVSLAE